MQPLDGQLDLFADEVSHSTSLASTSSPAATGLAWWGFSLDHDDADARRLFAQRFGVPPAEIRRVPGCLLAGPLPGM